MAESARITDLRRRVEADPASVLFAQLAEEYRRAGDYEAAVKCCRTGLTHHPSYFSARVTLGRALIEIGHLDAAEFELGLALKSAPENLTAVRGIAQIHRRRGQLDLALSAYREALRLARQDPEIEEAIEQITQELAAKKVVTDSRLRKAAGRPAPPAGPLVGAADAETRPTPELPLQVPGESASGIDFDKLLGSLGGDGRAPAPVEALLAAPPSREAATVILPEIAAETPVNDPFEKLERGLRDFALATAPASGRADTSFGEASAQNAPPAEAKANKPPTGASARDETAADEHVLAELEAWLAAIKR